MKNTKKDSKQILIVKAASTCFANFGYNKTSMKVIGQEAGLHKASLYHYFRNKEDLYTHVIFEETESYFQYLKVMMKNAIGPSKKISNLLFQRLKIANLFPNIDQTLFSNGNKETKIQHQLKDYLQQKEMEFLKKLLYQDGKLDHIEIQQIEQLSYGCLQLSNAYRKEDLQQEKKAEFFLLIELLFKGIDSW